MFFYLMFWWMFFSSIKGINRLISKGMSNIYLKVTIIVQLKNGNWLQIFRIEKAFGIWRTWVYSLGKYPATSMGVSGQGFYDVTKTKYGWINHNHVSRESYVVESGFVTQIKLRINILTDFEISHLKNQSLWIN